MKSIINGKTYFIKYNHLNKVQVKKGDSVNVGDVIGYSGNTGNAAQKAIIPHIHFQVFDSKWNLLDPFDYINTKFDSNFNPIKSNCK